MSSVAANEQILITDWYFKSLNPTVRHFPHFNVTKTTEIEAAQLTFVFVILTVLCQSTGRPLLSDTWSCWALHVYTTFNHFRAYRGASLHMKFFFFLFLYHVPLDTNRKQSPFLSGNTFKDPENLLSQKASYYE